MKKSLVFLVCLLPKILLAVVPEVSGYAFTLEVKEGKGTSRCGTGSLVKAGNNIYYVTAHHIFENCSDKQRAALVKDSSIVSEADHRLHFSAESFVTVAGVAYLTKTDFMIFKMKSNANLLKFALTLAPDGPQKGETVYLAARLPDFPKAATYPLKVLEVTAEQTHYEKISNVNKYTGASGGPILNEKGQLVGTYLGRSLSSDAKAEIQWLIGTPYLSVKEVLANLAAQK